MESQESLRHLDYISFNMKLTIPQLKSLSEMDDRLRSLQRRRDDPGSRAQYIVELLRSGKINYLDVTTAAIFGDPIAAQVNKDIGEGDPPTIDSASDIINMFGLYTEDMRKIFETIYAAAYEAHTNNDAIAKDAARDFLQVRLPQFNTHRVSQIEYWSVANLQRVIDAMGLEWVLLILKPAFVNQHLL